VVVSRIGNDIEDGDLDGAHLTLDGVDEGHHLLLLARVRPEGTRLAARGLDAGHQGRELVGGAAGDAGREALAGKPARNGAAGGIAGADHQGRSCVRHLQASLPTPRTTTLAARRAARLASRESQPAGLSAAKRALEKSEASLPADPCR
jgi:hypothetical protein